MSGKAIPEADKVLRVVESAVGLYLHSIRVWNPDITDDEVKAAAEHCIRKMIWEIENGSENSHSTK